MNKRVRSRLALVPLTALAVIAASLPGAAAAQVSVAIFEDFTQEIVGRPPTSFSTPVGFWSIATNGTDTKPLLFEDGTQWGGSQTASTLATQARSLYGERWNEFIDDLPSTAYFPIAIYNKVPNFTGGSITVRLASVGGDLDQDLGVLFNYQPNGDMLVLRIDSLENNVKLYQYVFGQPTVLSLVENVPTAMARWHDVKVVVTNGGRHVVGWMDGYPYLEADLETPVSGQVGAWAKSDTVALFDYFAVDPNEQ
jgi:hypothetical protein